MEKGSKLNRVLLYEGIGFLAIITLCWLDELVGLVGLAGLVGPAGRWVRWGWRTLT